MGARYTYATTLEYSTESGPDEIEVEVSYTVTWGSPEQAPAYDHGGLPADPDEVNDIALLSIDGVGGPFDQEGEAAILQEISTNERHYEAMIEEASQIEAAWAE